MGAKRLSDLTKLQAVTGQTNVLVEENGEAKRIPASNLIGATEEIVMDLLVRMEVAPVVLDENGAIFADGNGAILLNV